MNTFVTGRSLKEAIKFLKQPNSANGELKIDFKHYQ
jgi:hypothetical protein